jgi:hypothetical protein
VKALSGSKTAESSFSLGGRLAAAGEGVGTKKVLSLRDHSDSTKNCRDIALGQRKHEEGNSQYAERQEE